ncbi:zinc ribbon domain-containing protein [Arthrobacter mobilis]|uniref:ChsH2 rubredoxin-like zinc ribbon domain-containing protein n=1 Tax=Arthrobacter mobilis TaxID=2724944 RepID=A0A7X6HC68_9MICC|nr:zinc ribbon domain-containing protein [Arthrobacter mobilis]NKX54409.1 hypothetical protein [Arthrobacter mobilis]
MSAIIQACLGCETLLFPARLFCPRCGQEDFAPFSAEHGIVEQTTRLAGGTVLATLAIEGGPRVIARLTGGDAAPGQRLPLTNDPNAASGVHAYIPVHPNVNEDKP